MTIKRPLFATPKTAMLTAILVLLALSAPAFAAGKKHPQRAMIEKMEAVPCGAQQRGLAGVGALWGSIGATHVNSQEKLCPQYLLRTDDMEYHIRPMDHKHPVILPVGQEGEFKIVKNTMELRIGDGGKKRQYEVVAMKPIDHSQNSETVGAKDDYKPSQSGYADQSLVDKSQSR
jgi:hypothetical protein